MLAPNPLAPRLKPREPWETPGDLTPFLWQPHGHVVTLELGMRLAARHFTSADRIRRSPVEAMVWGGGIIPFPNYAQAARFVIDAGHTAQHEDTVAQTIRRASHKGVFRYGLTWKRQRDPDDGRVRLPPPVVPSPAPQPVAVPGMPASVSRIVAVVASFYEVTTDDILGRRRSERFAFPRQVSMYLTRGRTRYSVCDIGDFIGGRDHTTVLHACRTIERRIGLDADTASHVNQIKDMLR